MHTRVAICLAAQCGRADACSSTIWHSVWHLSASLAREVATPHDGACGTRTSAAGALLRGIANSEVFTKNSGFSSLGPGRPSLARPAPRCEAHRSIALLREPKRVAAQAGRNGAGGVRRGDGAGELWEGVYWCSRPAQTESRVNQDEGSLATAPSA
eukprot:scaffold1603_cov415-Prasinococcus_capsulatus_cf.AAC.15